MMSICQDGKLVREWDIFAIYERPQIALTFDGLKWDSHLPKKIVLFASLKDL